MNRIRLIEIAKEIEFKGVWADLEAGAGFQGQPVTGYFRLALVFMRGGALRGVFDFCFSRDVC